MPIKTYAIHGKSSATLYFTLNGHKAKVLFSGGIPDPLIRRPATVTTSDPFVIDAIEADPRYGKIIRKFNEKPTADEAAAKADPKGTAAKAPSKDVKPFAEPKVYPGITNVAGAREVLLSLGCNAAQTINRDTAKATAAAMNVQFPDWL